MNFGQFLLYAFWIFILFAFLIVIFRLLVDIFRSDDMGGFVKALWIIFLIFFPPITALIYLIARGKGMADREIRAATEAQKAQQQYIREVSSAGDPVAQIAQAKTLLDNGTISQEEFDGIKAKALAS